MCKWGQVQNAQIVKNTSQSVRSGPVFTCIKKMKRDSEPLFVSNKA